MQYEFLSLVITKLLLLSHSKVRFYKYFNSKFLDLGQCVEIDIATSVHKHEPEEMFS